MKKIYFSLVFSFWFCTAYAQVKIQWQKSLGGTGLEEAHSIQQTNDGGYIVAGFSDDYWVVKLAGSGAIQWQKSLGGSGRDEAHSIQQTSDGGYIVAGFSGSNDGDVTGNHGYYDFWVVKLSSIGGIQWQKCLGGTGADGAKSIQQTSDGGYIIAGTSDSNNGDVTGNHGSSDDYWVVKMDGSGAIQWQKSLGGSGYEHAYSIQQTSDGGYIVAGYSSSNSGDVTGNHGYSDYWVVKLDGSGAIQWQKSLGGIGNEYAYSIQQTSDGGYIVAGYSNFNNGDVTGNHGYSDYWVVKLDGSGIIQWQKSLGGSSIDYAYSIQQTSDGGYIVVGLSSSIDGDVTGNNSFDDYWVVKLDSSGSIQWQKSLGGTNNDRAYAIQQTTDGGYIVAGWSISNDGDVTGNHGNYDYWIVKLTNDFNKIAGNCFIDFNQDGIKDINEPNAKNVSVKATRNADFHTTSTDAIGNFELYVDTGIYSVSVKNLPYYNIVPAADTSIFYSYKNTDTINFALVPIAPDIQDLRTNILSLNPLRTGREANYRIQYSNIGTDTMSGTVYMIKDSRTTFVSSVPSQTSISGDSIGWPYTNLLPAESRTIDITLQVGLPPTVNTGDLLNTVAVIEPVATDTTPADNRSCVCEQPVVGSYDPNDKAMLEGSSFSTSQVTAGEYLTYMVRFQNTGNDTAFTVIIRDTLDNKLDGGTLEMVSSSHSCRLAMLNEKYISWTFDNILLPDSNVDEANSHGYVAYRIKPKSTVITNDEIRNTAYIYFDYNSPVKTNTVITTITESVITGVRDIAHDGLAVYPNPSGGRFTIVFNNAIGNASIKIFNTLGTVIKQAEITTAKTEIDLSTFSPGIYFYSINTEAGKVFRGKMVKE